MESKRWGEKKGTGWWKQTSKRNIEVAIWNRLCIWIVDEEQGDSLSDPTGLETRRRQQSGSISFAWSIPHKSSPMKKGEVIRKRRETGETESEKKKNTNNTRESELNHSQHRGADVNAAPLTRTLKVYSHDSNTWADFKYLKKSWPRVRDRVLSSSG